MNEILSRNETEELSKYERIIAENLVSFYLIGMALAAIKQKKLYRSQFGILKAMSPKNGN